ncbi:MAG: glutathione binding-like protein [Luteibacter sp.]
MKLYYAPATCSQACHIALIEAALPYTLVKVGRDKLTDDGRDFRAINEKGYTPALELDDGTVLTENAAILAYLADTSGQLLAREGTDRWRALEATAFMTSEIHRHFLPFFRPEYSDEEKNRARQALDLRFGTLARQLGDKPFLVGDTMTIADTYLFVMLSWAAMMGIAVPAPLETYHTRLKSRPSIARALAEEGLD